MLAIAFSPALTFTFVIAVRVVTGVGKGRHVEGGLGVLKPNGNESLEIAASLPPQAHWSMKSC